jgi:LacI family transcriptional regulator
MSKQKRVTIKEVAKYAGVSIQTVSRVINKHPDVAPETRLRVLSVITELDYHPSALARSLIQQKTFTLGVLTAGLKFIGPSFTLNGITVAAEEMKYAILLEELPGFYDQRTALRLESFLARHVDGIIWAVPEIGDNRTWLDQNRISLPVPIVFLTMQPRQDVTCVSFDNFWGGRLATQHLIDAGYRNIGHIAGPLDWWEARQRKAGWEMALEMSGLDIGDRLWVEGNWSSASGERAFLDLLSRNQPLDAVFVANDQMAYSVYHVAAMNGIRIPEDLGVVGFDGLAETAYLWPPLTTVHQNLNQLGRIAVENVVSAIESQQVSGGEQPGASVVLLPELICRASSQRSQVQQRIVAEGA